MTAATWRYAHQDLDEPHLPDGSSIMRPCVIVSTGADDSLFLGVVDSGSPVTVADSAFLAEAGIDIATDEPVMELPLGLGATFGRVPVFEVGLQLVPPDDVDAAPRPWRLHVAARPIWRLPFTILFGQRGWFDTYTTTIGARDTLVHIDD
jgi:hypothetical protein